MRRVRVLVVDDSRFMVSLISSVLEKDPELEVVGFALDGRDAVDKARQLQPDVITMDVMMPRMDGLEATRAIVAELSVPIIVFSAHTPQGAGLTVEALQAGAVDCLSKPSGELSMSLDSVARELVDKVKGVGRQAASRTVDAGGAAFSSRSWTTLPSVAARARASGTPAAVVIGASTGGIQALQALLPRFDERVPFAVVVVQHFPEGFTSQLAGRLDAICSLPVREAEPGRRLERASVVVAPGGKNLEITSALRIRLSEDDGPAVLRPSVDVTLRSAARTLGPEALGVILTGMGRDGAQGAAELFRAGGRVIVEDFRTSTAWGMPRAVYETGCYDAVLPLEQIAGHILKLSGLL
ncbi:MAG: chemotaxis response regulator protein-glutamate methylesterase [Deltaproteobacteria bacterium]|nr:chemotaxis response regulator protein-glutamate methylesterase [Deltaproteobacteria bacterium]